MCVFVFSDSDDDDGLPPDPMGISRVADALQAHTWPNLEMKKSEQSEGQNDDGDRTEQRVQESSAGAAAASGDGAATKDSQTKDQATPIADKEEVKSKIGKLFSPPSVFSSVLLIIFPRFSLSPSLSLPLSLSLSLSLLFSLSLSLSLSPPPSLSPSH